MRAVREAERARRAYERSAAADEKERKRLYLESRVAEVEAMNEQLDQTISALEGLLAATLDVDDFLDFEALKEAPELPTFQPGALSTPEPPPRIEAFLPTPLGLIEKLVPGAKAKHERALEDARQGFEAESAAHQKREAERERALGEARSQHQQESAQVVAR